MKLPMGVFLFAAATLFGAATAEPATSGVQLTYREFSIEAQPLSSALQALARRYDQQIIFPDRLTSGKYVKRISGRYSLAAALALLLRDTGLTYRPAGRGIVIVVDLQTSLKNKHSSPASVDSPAISQAHFNRNAGYSLGNTNYPAKRPAYHGVVGSRKC